MRARYPDLPFPEITKRLGAEWTRLAQNDKQVVIQALQKCIWHVLFDIVYVVPHITVSTGYIMVLYYWASWAGIRNCTQKPSPRIELQMLLLCLSFAARSIIICLALWLWNLRAGKHLYDKMSHMTSFQKLKRFQIIKHVSISKTKPFPQYSSTTLFVHWQRYLDEAEREKMQYAQDLKEYQQTEAYQITSAKIQDKRIKKGDNWALLMWYMFCWLLIVGWWFFL